MDKKRTIYKHSLYAACMAVPYASFYLTYVSTSQSWTHQFRTQSMADHLFPYEPLLVHSAHAYIVQNLLTFLRQSFHHMATVYDQLVMPVQQKVTKRRATIHLGIGRQWDCLRRAIAPGLCGYSWQFATDCPFLVGTSLVCPESYRQ